MRLALIVLLPFLGALLPPIVIRGGRDFCATVTASVTTAALALLLAQAPEVFAGHVLTARIAWVPAIGLDFNLFLDGLGFLFAFLILGIGLLVIIYARHYLAKDDPMGRFFAYLLLFQGAMLGIVLSDNVLLLLVFWELTSLSSFLLIGFWRHLPEGRQGARMALIVTGSGGLALIAGLLILGSIAGSNNLSAILQQGDLIKASPLYLTALLLILLGAFTKSAQFPFHFWLPHAMAAPTPVSAYLHSATMVKAGVFLLARLWPVLAGTDAWFLIVSLTGLVTMVIGAWIALFKDDLKALLAYSTVSYLGAITMLLGLGTPLAVVAALFFLLNHAVYKAALFLTAGVVDHEVGSRDLRELGGIARYMPLTATLAAIAAASMAGLPPLNGFVAKEMLLEVARPTVYAGQAWLFPVLVTVAALLAVAYAGRFAIGTFFGPAKALLTHPPHDPPFGMWGPIAVLVVLAVLIGLAPGVVTGRLLELASSAALQVEAPDAHLALWHGVTPAFWLTVVAVACGIIFYLAWAPIDSLRRRVPRPVAKPIFDAIIEFLATAAADITQRLHNGSLQRYAAIVLGAILVVGYGTVLSGGVMWGTRPTLPSNVTAIGMWIVAAVTTLGVAFFHHRRLLALILTSAVGLVVALAFLYFSAPDLGLTQLSVEVVTTILMLLALNLLPKETPRESKLPRKLRDAALALAAGLGMAVAAYAVMTRDFHTISAWQLEQSLPVGGGSNVVNVILVDIRGYDTFGEIIVLGIAALAIFAMLESAVRGAAGRRLARTPQAVESRDAHPLLLVLGARVLLPLAAMVGVYIMLRGHNEPGGGFIAGLVIGIALIIQYMASGYVWAAERVGIPYHGLIGAGVLLAGLTGIGAWAFGLPFLTSGYDHFHLPVIGDLELATAMLFDLGVFLTVVGVVLLSLASLSRLERKAAGTDRDPGPIDVPLPERATA